jgi:hypothetical protein
MLLSTLVRFLHRCFQPHLDQMKHGAVNDPARYRLEKLRMRKRIKIPGNVCVYDLSMSSVNQLMDVSYCVQCAAASPIGVLFRLQVNLENGVEYKNRRHHDRAVTNSGHS